jgi:hypothetical protein
VWQHALLAHESGAHVCSLGVLVKMHGAAGNRTLVEKSVAITAMQAMVLPRINCLIAQASPGVEELLISPPIRRDISRHRDDMARVSDEKVRSSCSLNQRLLFGVTFGFRVRWASIVLP